MRPWLALLALALVPLAHAEQAHKFGAIEVHYNAMLTSDLVPEVAKAYKINRSKKRGILTVSVLKTNDVGVAQPVPAKLKAYLINVNNQLGRIAMREVREGTAIYYLGEFGVIPPDALKFKIDVETAAAKHEVNFTQSFYE